MSEVFSYIIGLGASVMMPVIFTVLGVGVGVRFSKALKSGLKVSECSPDFMDLDGYDWCFGQNHRQSCLFLPC